MQADEFLRNAAALPGLTGNERAVAEYIADAFRPYCDDVRIDAMNSVIAHQKGEPGAKKVMLCAHLDEIGMMVSKIEDDGALRMQRVGGVDPRILPGQRVRVYGRETLMGVVGAKAPHLLTAKEREENYTFETLYVDLGMDASRVRALVRVGDDIALEARYTELLNGRAATKTADDRACVAILLCAAEQLRRMSHWADVTFVATCQEEIGSYGAWTAGFSVAPDYGIALDVCHAYTPGAPVVRTHSLEGLAAAVGPFIQPYMRKKLDEVAKRERVRIQRNPTPGRTSTDADKLSLSRAGVPTVLLELPLKYMHTTVETFDMNTLIEGARLISRYVADIDETWEAALWN